ncbi:adenylate/guanylate cyclase domain-containing protein [Pelagibius sp. 7325]|uniref:adenylate/guanylate cyclase domain-containing protein n=1 Tax=Pelagibius sp. 7325 TaxID=3131994 RepID=UPI0030ED12FB
MQSVEIIDVDSDPTAARRAFWRRVVRFGLPAGGIVVVAAGLIASAVYTNAMNKADVLALSRDFIGSLNARVHSDVRAFLDPTQTAVGSLAAVVPAEPLSEPGRALFERLARDLLHRHPQLASAYLGTAEGEFLMVRRNEAGTADTKVIWQTPEGRQSVWTRRDAGDQVIAIEEDPDDPYDPRTRDWFQDARQGDGIAWSRVYIFFTDKAPGITASTAVSRSGDAPSGGTVVGVDINLSSLSGFLAGLQDEARGTLAIVNDDGQVVAFHEPERVMIEQEGQLRSRTIRELGYPALAEAFDRLRVEGPDRSIIEIDGNRYVFSAASLQGAVSRAWWLILLAPESAYLGFIAVNGRRGLIAAGGIIALAFLLAALLTWQGIVAERRARAVRATGARLEKQRHTFDELAGLTALADPGDEHDLRRATEILALAEAASRVGIWRLARDGRGLVCLDAFETQTGSHAAGTSIRARDFETLFAAIVAGQTLDIPDARNDRRAEGLQMTYFQAVETNALTSLPIVAAGGTWGALWIEDADPAAAVDVDRSVARTVANLVAPRLQAMAASEQVKPAPRETRSESLHGSLVIPRGQGDAKLSSPMLRKASLLDLRRQRSAAENNGQAMGATVYRNATVLVLKLLDDDALAACSSGSKDGAVIREVVGIFKEAADRVGIPYVKILTDQVLAVDGFGGDDLDGAMAAAAARQVAVALNVRERCNAIFLAAGLGPQFAMGLDSGTVFGSAVGFGDSPYNVWGEAVRVAITMAETADRGTIQVSEATYELLRGDCIFRRRGAFYLGQLGEMSTFTLRSRL